MRFSFRCNTTPRPSRRRAAVLALACAFLLGGTTAMAADTAALWDKHCASCHGKDGKAKTKMGEKLKVRDLSDPAVKAKVTKASAVDSMKNGVKGEDGDKLVMKAFTDKLSEEEIQALADYSLSFK